MTERAAESLPRAQRARALLVLGMHRSGTSAVTRVLNLLGADLPSDLLPAVPGDNAPGFWESSGILETHEALLAAIGSSWHDVKPLPEGWLKSDEIQTYQDRMLGIIEREFGHSKLFTLKDPRLCRLVPFWTSVLDRFEAEVGFILPIRNPLEVANSLGVRNGFSLAKSLLLWLRHILDAERETRTQERSFVSYDELLRDWPRVVGDVARDLGLVWPRNANEASSKVDEFLSDRHRHHTFSSADLEANGEVVAWVRDAYAAAVRARQDPRGLEETFDALAGRLEEADRAFVPLLEQAEATESELRGELASHVGALREARLHNDQLASGVAEKQGAIESLTAQVTEKQGAIESLTAQVTEKQGAIESLTAQVAERQGAIESLTAQVAEGHGTIERLNAQVEAVRGELEKTSAEAHRWQTRAEELDAELVRARGAADRANEELRKVQSHLTQILSGRLMRYTRPFRRLWHRMRASLRI